MKLSKKHLKDLSNIRTLFQKAFSNSPKSSGEPFMFAPSPPCREPKMGPGAPGEPSTRTPPCWCSALTRPASDGEKNKTISFVETTKLCYVLDCPLQLHGQDNVPAITRETSLYQKGEVNSKQESKQETLVSCRAKSKDFRVSWV